MATLSLTAHAAASDMIPAPAIADLYEQYWEAVYGTALRVTGNPADAEDVMQTVFLRVLHQGNRLDPALAPERYLRRAATNASLDILRRRVSRAEAQFDDTSPYAAHDSPVLLKERLRRALATLEARDAEMFVLRYVEGLSNGELGEMFGIGVKNVAVRLHRIRQALKAEMGR
jgi:RNA polymerase sigma-70 factor, ECF subfamily